MDGPVIPMGIHVPEVAIADVMSIIVPHDHFMSIHVPVIPNIDDPPFTGECRGGAAGQNRKSRDQGTDLHISLLTRGGSIPAIDGRATCPAHDSFA